MLFFKFLKTLFLGIAKLLAFCVKIIYNILKLLKIRVLALYLVVCGFVQLIFHAFDENLVWFILGFALCCLITVTAWIVSFTRSKRAKARTREPEKEERGEEKPSAPVSPPAPVREQPRYYWVKGHKDYYFAEYNDRYELFRRTESGDLYIRTDYK